MRNRRGWRASKPHLFSSPARSLGRGQAPNLIPGARTAKSHFQGLIDPFSGTGIVLQGAAYGVNCFNQSNSAGSLSMSIT
jgi:hypothetical protein